MADLNIHIRITPGLARASLAATLIVASAGELSPESVTLTTYYPAPSGVYERMIATQDATLARDGGRVGVGTSSPAAKLHVVGDLLVESRARVGGVTVVGPSTTAEGDPGNNLTGAVYYNPGLKQLRVFDGAWKNVAGETWVTDFQTISVSCDKNFHPIPGEWSLCIVGSYHNRCGNDHFGTRPIAGSLRNWEAMCDSCGGNVRFACMKF